MKKILALLLVLLLVFSAAACGKTPAPSKVLDEILKEIKKTDYTKEAELAEIMEALGAENTKEFVSLFTDFDYEILDEEINDDTATVTVKITTYNFGQMFIEAVQEYILQVFSIAFSNPDITEEELVEILQDIFTDKISKMEKNFTQTIDVGFTLTDEGWVLDYELYESELFDAILGGMIKAIDEFADSLNQVQ